MSSDNISGMDIGDIIINESDTITIDLSSAINTASTMYVTDWSIHGNTISTISNPTVSPSWLTNSSFIFSTEYKDFVDTMPPISTIHDMCEIYPGLKKAFDHFKDVYDLVKGDYEARKNSDE